MGVRVGAGATDGDQSSTGGPGGDRAVQPQRLICKRRAQFEVGADRLTALVQQVRERRTAGRADRRGRLVVSEATAKTHVASILQKPGLRDRVQAMMYAYETGLLPHRSTNRPNDRLR